LVDSLEIRSTTQDQSLIEAVKFLLENQHRRGEWLPKSIQLDFAGELWQRQVLGTYSRKNRLYQAFRELGRAVRTIFLLRYISDRGWRRIITASTNQVEAFQGFLDWVFFGKDGVITENDPEEQEKRVKYLHLVANAVILQNAVDISHVIQTLVAQGHSVNREMIRTLSPYMTGHIKRYGDYVVDFSQIPQPLETALELPVDW
jgi:hypothetical protein